MDRIGATRSELKRLLGEGLDLAFGQLAEEISPVSPKFDIYIQLKSRYSAYLSLTIIGGTSQKELDQTYNALSASLLGFINTLLEQDLKPLPETAQPASSKKRGELLYNIPHEMEEQREHRCAVRVAYDEAALLEDWRSGKEDIRRQVRVAEVMAVEMLNVSSDTPFEIRAVSETVQFLEADEATEWVFYIRPLMRGEFPLILKVSVIEVINGREAKKDVVIEEHVIVSNTASKEEAFKSAGVDLQLAAPVSGAAPAQSPATKSKSKAPAMAAFLALIVLLPSVTWALTPAATRDWWWAAWQDTAESYAAYVDQYRDTDSPHLQKAFFRKAARSGEVRDYRQYLARFGAAGRFTARIQDSLNVLEIRKVQVIFERPDTFSVRRFLADFPESKRLPELKRAVESKSAEPVRAALLSELEAAEGRLGAGNGHTLRERDNAPARDSSLQGKAAGGKTPLQNRAELMPENAPRPVTYAQGNGDARTAPSGRSGFEMIRVAGGAFTMGQPDPNIGCSGCSGAECPHEVKVAGFSIGRYEVTQADWRKVMGSDPPSLQFKGCDDCPVERVSWKDVEQFLTTLNKRLPAGKRPYRLPTEAEWEFAARGGNRSNGYKFSGSDHVEKVAWYQVNSNNKTHPVGSLKANELGLYDMSGNVYEWCADVWMPYPCDPVTKKDEAGRAIRGGSWDYSNAHCRSTGRVKSASDFRGYGIGFRLAR